MNQYLRCPSAFQQFSEDGLEIMPSESYLQKLKAAQQVSDGFNVGLLLPQATYRGTGKFEVGEVACDEMKLERALRVNVKNNKVTGMESDFYDLGRIVKNLLDDKNVDEDKAPAVYVNQYCYRATDGRVYPVMCFFNSGSLSANVAMQQLFLGFFLL